MPRIPLALKLAWTAWIAAWAWIYGTRYGAWNFLWFCDVGNFVIAAALWLESPLLFSWQATALLIPQSLFCVDISWRAATGSHLIGGTEFLFDPAIPLWLRLLTLFHVVVPPLLLYGVARLGYDRRAFRLQLVAGAVILAASLLAGPERNVNWAHGLFGRPHPSLPAPWPAVVAWLGAALLLWWPAHLGLKRWVRDPRAG